jgi:hypothetical protein
VLELEQSERQQILRDMNNRITRDDIDILDRFGALIKERIIKVLIKESDTMFGALRMWVFSDCGWLYIFHVNQSYNYHQNKVSL